MARRKGEINEMDIQVPRQKPIKLFVNRKLEARLSRERESPLYLGVNRRLSPGCHGPKVQKPDYFPPPRPKFDYPPSGARSRPSPRCPVRILWGRPTRAGSPRSNYLRRL